MIDLNITQTAISLYCASGNLIDCHLLIFDLVSKGTVDDIKKL